ncbi:MAG: ABC transporter ATP-binding protein [Pseudobdellovibrionaceae bacterium]
MENPALKLDNVTISLGGETILKDVNFEVAAGETFVIIGPSGSGKTVLLKTMAGVYKPEKGEVYCEGEDWQKFTSEKKNSLLKKIGVQFQKSALFDSMNAFENVAFPLREHTKLDEASIEKKVHECLDSVGLWEAKDLMPHELSGGMKQRLGIARSLALNPEIIFYDDPTAGLDPINTDILLDVISHLKQIYHSTIIMVTHNLICAYKMADRIALVGNKQVIVAGTPEETQKSTNELVHQFVSGSLNGPLKWD